MDIFDNQAAWLRERGWVRREDLEQTLGEARVAGAQDLFDALVGRGFLAPDQAYKARQATTVGDRRDPLGLPREVGPYRLLQLLARGGMGEVYRACHRESGEAIALKLISEDDKGSERRLRFRREAEALLRLKHANIVEIKDFGEAEGRPYLAMELLSAAPLLRWARGADAPPERCDWRRLCGLGARIARALEACHARGVIHRDIKPDNILIEDLSDRPVLIDFGLARFQRPNIKAESAGSSELALTPTGEVLGTPAFLAPEQLGDEAIGPAADVWSLGATLFAALTGARPFNGRSAYQIYRAILTAEPLDPRSFNARIPRGLGRLILSCLRRDPAARPSMSALARGLEAAPGRPRRRALLSVSAGLLGFAGLLGLALRGPAAPPLRLLPGSRFTREATALVRGRADRSGRRIRLSGARALTIIAGPEGRFSERLPLILGRNRIVASLSADPEARVEVELIRDPDPPRIILDQPLFEGALELDGEGAFSGRIEEPWLVEARVDGAPLSLAADGRFRASPAGSAVEITAEDGAGNRARLALPVLSRAALRARLLAALKDRRAWGEASRGLIARVGAELAAGLGAGYEALGDQDFRCGALSHRILAYRHRGSGLVLHLIPGGVSTVGEEAGAAPRFKRAVAPFLIARSELTCGEWSAGRGEPQPLRPQRPQGGLSAEAARGWLETMGLRLPSEAEWEHAARAGARGAYFWGEAFDGRYAWFSGNTAPESRGGASPGGRRPREPRRHRSRGRWNAFGLVDTLGNLYELCAGDDDRDGKGAERARGGCCSDGPAALSCAAPAVEPAGEARALVGLRPARSLPPWGDG